MIHLNKIKKKPYFEKGGRGFISSHHCETICRYDDGWMHGLPQNQPVPFKPPNHSHLNQAPSNFSFDKRFVLTEFSYACLLVFPTGTFGTMENQKVTEKRSNSRE